MTNIERFHSAVERNSFSNMEYAQNADVYLSDEIIPDIGTLRRYLIPVERVSPVIANGPSDVPPMVYEITAAIRLNVDYDWGKLENLELVATYFDQNPWIGKPEFMSETLIAYDKFTRISEVDDKSRKRPVNWSPLRIRSDQLNFTKLELVDTYDFSQWLQYSKDWERD